MTTVLNAAISEDKVDFAWKKSLQDFSAKDLHILPLPGHQGYSQRFNLFLRTLLLVQPFLWFA